MASGQLTFKSILGSDCRRFHLDTSFDYSSIHTKLRDVYKLPTDEFVMKYKDNDGDLVTVTNDSELTDMMHELRITAEHAAPIRIEVHVKEDPHAVSDQDVAQMIGNPPSYYRSFFDSAYSDQEIIDVLHDISLYISGRDKNLSSVVASERSLIKPSVMSRIYSTLPSKESPLVSKPRYDFQIPEKEDDPVKWNTAAVGNWLKAVGYPELERNFKENDVSGDVLFELDHDTLREMGIISTGKRVKLLKLIEKLKEKRSSKTKSTRHKSFREEPTSNFSTPKKK